MYLVSCSIEFTIPVSEVSLGLPLIGEGGAINWDVIHELVSVADYYMTLSVAHRQCGVEHMAPRRFTNRVTLLEKSLIVQTVSRRR